MLRIPSAAFSTISCFAGTLLTEGTGSGSLSGATRGADSLIGVVLGSFCFSGAVEILASSRGSLEKNYRTRFASSFGLQSLNAVGTRNIGTAIPSRMASLYRISFAPVLVLAFNSE